jgi:KRAB domain-containing zinc finger protein
MVLPIFKFVLQVANKKVFSEKGNLAKHKVIHTEERPFVCEICGKAFKYRSNLNSHRKVCSGEKPYICEVCNKQFARKDYLKAHMKRH